MKKALIILFPIALVILGGILALNAIQSQQQNQSNLEQDPNKDFNLKGKNAFNHKFKGDSIIYEFENRNPDDPRASKNIYDPSNWLLTFFPDKDGTAAFKITEGQVEALTGNVRQDGLFRVSSYKGVQGEPREFWQTLFNMFFFLPRSKEELDAPQFREFEFPSAGDHRIAGKVKFSSLGRKDLVGLKPLAIEVYIELEVLTRLKGDKLTEFVAEGVVYYLEDEEQIVAGEWEWATGFMDQIFVLGGGWNYVLFHTRGLKPREKVKDLVSLSANLQWGWIKDTTPDEWQINAFEMGVRNKLFHMGEEQEVFRSAAIVDQDGDGQGEYGLLREITHASSKLRSDGGFKDWPVKAPDLKLLTSYGDVNDKGFSMVDGYRYKIFLQSAGGLISDEPQVPGSAKDADAQESPGSYCIYAWPEKPGKTGRKVFFTNGGGKVWSTLKPPFDPDAGMPAPAGTALPEGMEWKAEEKGKMFDVKYVFVTQAGKPVEGRTQQLLEKVSGIQAQMNLLHQDKLLGPQDYYRAVKLSRSMLRARADGEMTLQEAESLALDYGDAYSRILIENVGESLLAWIESQTKDKPLPEAKAAEFAVLRKDLAAFKAALPCDPEKAEDVVDRIREFLSRGW